MKTSRQFKRREGADAAADVLTRNGIRYDISPIVASSSVAYPEFVNPKLGGVPLSIEDKDRERGMQLICESDDTSSQYRRASGASLQSPVRRWRVSGFRHSTP